MEWLSQQILPDICRQCKYEDCYGCEHAGLRWCLSEEDMLKNRRKMLLKAIERLQCQVQAIDQELEQLSVK